MYMVEHGISPVDTFRRKDVIYTNKMCDLLLFGIHSTRKLAQYLMSCM